MVGAAAGGVVGFAAGAAVGAAGAAVGAAAGPAQAASKDVPNSAPAAYTPRRRRSRRVLIAIAVSPFLKEIWAGDLLERDAWPAQAEGERSYHDHFDTGALEAAARFFGHAAVGDERVDMLDRRRLTKGDATNLAVVDGDDDPIGRAQ